jgi:hypothetical protein
MMREATKAELGHDIPSYPIDTLNIFRQLVPFFTCSIKSSCLRLRPRFRYPTFIPQEKMWVTWRSSNQILAWSRTNILCTMRWLDRNALQLALYIHRLDQCRLVTHYAKTTLWRDTQAHRSLGCGPSAARWSVESMVTFPRKTKNVLVMK